MNSTSMALVKAGGNSVPIMFPVGESGYVVVSVFPLSIRFNLSENLVHIDEEVFDVDSGDLNHTPGQDHVSKNPAEWHLRPRRYFAYGLASQYIGQSSQGVIGRVSSTNTPHTPTATSVKIEPGCEVITLETRGGHSPRFSNLRAAEKVKQVKHLKI